MDIRPSLVINHHEYFNMSDACRYVAMTDAGLRKKLKRLENEYGVKIPIIHRPGERQRFIDKRILDLFKRTLLSSTEFDTWLDELRRTIQEVER